MILTSSNNHNEMMRAGRNSLSRSKSVVMRYQRAKTLWTWAAAALSTTSRVSPSVAYFVQPHQGARKTGLSTSTTLSPRQYPLQSRLYAKSSRTEKDDGFLGGLKKTAKSLLPSSWFQSEEEKRAAIERQRVQDDLKGGLKELFKDAPLPVRMIGGMVAPLLTNVMSGLAETMAEQQEVVDDVLNEARQYLAADPAVAQMLGDGGIQVGTPFSQSSSSTSINGQTTTQVQLAFPVTGSLQSGVAQVVSANGKLQRLVLQVGGRTTAVSLSSKTPSARTFRNRGPRSGSPDDDIIEAEIIEKDTKN